jgi:2-haloalkanoic acid dehalogenase type II
VICSEDDHALFGKSVPHWPVFADAPAGMQYFKRYFKLAVLSNVDRENLSSSSRRLEVKFDAVFSAQDIGSYKPDPRNFEYMVHKLGKLGWSKQGLLHAAQSPTQDLAPAVACGLAAAWIDRRREIAQADAAVTDAGVRHDFRFTSLADMVKAHQEQLRA